MIYVASPYNGDSKELTFINYHNVATFCAELIATGEVAISPVAYGHNLLTLAEIPSDWEFWKKFCTDILSRCEKMIVLTLDGWEKSSGVTAEIQIAKKLGIPIIYARNFQDYKTKIHESHQTE